MTVVTRDSLKAATGIRWHKMHFWLPLPPLLLLLLLLLCRPLGDEGVGKGEGL
jgi:hypothetical protein